MADRYPDTPGAKGTDGTSEDAAEAIAPAVSHLRRIALEAVAKLGSATALEVSAFAWVTREAIQPRLSELRAMGLIEPTGARRRNPSGKSASVLRLTDKGRTAL